MTSAPDVTVVIVNYNTASLLPKSIGALELASSAMAVQTIIVDNASRDDSVDLIQSTFPDCQLVVNKHNVGFGRANNLALEFARGRYVLLLNTDAFVAPDTLERTVGYMDDHPGCGVLGVKLIGRDAALQPSARYFPTVWNLFLARTGLHRVFRNVRMVDDMAREHASTRSCDWVPGCYYLIRRDVIDQIGLFDPRYFLYYEEIDHCRAVKDAGWEVTFYPHTSVVHIGGESARSDSEITESGRQIEVMQMESELLYFRKHGGAISVWLNVMLTTLAELILLAKRILKGKSAPTIATSAKRVGLSWSLLIKTRWGSQATR